VVDLSEKGQKFLEGEFKAHKKKTKKQQTGDKIAEAGREKGGDGLGGLEKGNKTTA